VAVFLAEIDDVEAGCFEDPQAEQPEQAHSAKSYRFGEVRAAVSSAPSWRWVSPSVGDSGGTKGRRTCSAGECSSRPSMTAVRWNPATTDIRRDVMDGLNWRISCLHRAYSSTYGRDAAAL
jgi:hypothetical protein